MSLSQNTAVLLCSIVCAALVIVPSLLGVEPHAVYFNTKENRTVQADLYDAGSQTGVVMVHGARFTTASWQELASRLHDAGLTSLAIDMSESNKRKRRGGRRLNADILAGIQYLLQHDCTNIVLIGAGSATTDIVRLANNASDGQIIAVVLFAPSTGVKIESQSIKKLILYSSGEQFAENIREYYQSLPELKSRLRTRVKRNPN